MAKVNNPDACHSPLNAAQERQIRALFQAVMDDNIVLIRSFAGDSAGSYVLSKNVNRVTEKHPELLKTAVSMMLYPAIKWMLQAKDIDTLIKACECMDINTIDAADIQRLREIQTWLSPYVDRDAVHFRRRELYFSTCEKLVSTIQNVRQELHFESHYTQAMGDIYDCFLDPQKLIYNNRHKIVQYCERCIPPLLKRNIHISANNAAKPLFLPLRTLSSVPSVNRFVVSRKSAISLISAGFAMNKSGGVPMLLQKSM